MKRKMLVGMLGTFVFVATMSGTVIITNAETVAETKADIEKNRQLLKDATAQGLITPDMLQEADPDTPVVSDEEFYAIVNRNRANMTEEEYRLHYFTPTEELVAELTETEQSNSTELQDSNTSGSNNKEAAQTESEPLSEEIDSTEKSTIDESKVESKDEDVENEYSKEEPKTDESKIDESENTDTLNDVSDTNPLESAPVAILSVFGVLSGALAGLLQMFK